MKLVLVCPESLHDCLVMVLESYLDSVGEATAEVLMTRLTSRDDVSQQLLRLSNPAESIIPFCGRLMEHILQANESALCPFMRDTRQLLTFALYQAVTTVAQQYPVPITMPAIVAEE